MTNALHVRESRRDELLAAAIRCFATRGFEGASTREIAREAGAKQPLLYYHFGSKADLYLAAVLDQLDRLHEGLQAALSDRQDHLDRLHTFVRTYYDHFTIYEPGLAVCLREISGLPGDLAERISAAHRRVATGVLQGIIAGGMAEGVFRMLDAEGCAYAIIAILQGFLRLRDAIRDRLGSETPVAQVLDVYCAGLVAGAASGCER